jgi:enoyl-CoA hydratase
MTMEAIAVSVDQAIATVELIGPGKGNALGPAFWREMPEAFAALDADDAVRAVILTGRGSNFTFGLDLLAMASELGPHLAGGLARQRTALLAEIRRLQRAIDAVEQCRKPVIAAVAGWCIGGGVDLICACDVRLAAADARFSVRETRLAMVADLGTLQRLPLIVGQGHARELALTARDCDAERALRIGLVNEVYGDRDGVLLAARLMAMEIADNSPLAVQGAKQVMNASRGRPVEEGLERVALWNAAFLASEDVAEAFGAFAARRPPRYKGR